jgi:hypothetical protein
MHHADSAFFDLRRIPPLGGVTPLGCSHDSILSKRKSLHNFQGGSGLVVIVGGKKARVVPVLARYHDLLCAAADFAGARYVVGGRDPRRQNVTTPLISSLAGGMDLARLDAGRLRASWLMTCAEAIGLSSFMTAAGLNSSQRLGDLAATMPPRSEAEVVALLGGRAE